MINLINMKFSLIRGKILSAIAENQPISVTKLSEIVGISKGTTIYRYLNELETRGLIKIKGENKKRGKPKQIFITEKAKPYKFENINKTIKSLEKMNKLFK